VEVSALLSFTIFAFIQIALHLKLHRAYLILPFLCGYLPEQGRPIDPLLPDPSRVILGTGGNNYHAGATANVSLI
jgi:hypothetical protein